MSRSSSSSSATNGLALLARSDTGTGSSSDHPGQPGLAVAARMAGWPVEVIATLAAPKVFARVAGVVDAEEGILGAGRALADALYGPVAAAQDRVQRRTLLALRRDAFAGRLPRRTPDPALLAALPAAVADQLTRWVQARTRLAADQAALGPWLEDRLRAQQRSLARLTQRDEYRRAIGLASPALTAALDRLGEDQAEPGGRVAVSANAYAMRMAAKTSPYSTLTSLASARWVSDGPWLRWMGPHHLVSAVRTRPEPALDLVEEIVAAVAADPASHDRFLVRLNPSARRRAGHLRYVACHGRDGETVRALPATPAVECVLAALPGSDVDVGTLVHLVSSSAGIPPGHARALIRRLHDAGLLMIHPGVADNSPDPLCDLFMRLRLDPSLHDQAAGVAGVHASLRSYQEARCHGARRAALAAVRRAAAALVGSQGRWDPRYLTEERQVITEDSYLAAGSVALSTASWEPVLDDLRLAAHLLELQDPALGGRVLAGQLLQQYPAGIGLLDLFECAHQRVTDRAEPWTMVVNSFRGVPVAAAGHELTDLAARRDVLSRWLRHQPRDADEIEVPAPVLAAAVQRRPVTLPGCSSLAAFCLPMLLDGQPGAVISAVQAGYGRHASRLARLTGKRSARPRQRTEGPTPVEIAGAFGSNLNLCGITERCQLSYPGSVGDQPPAAQIPLTSLSVRPDARSGLPALWSDQLGQRLLPVHRGTGSVKLLPPLARFILGMFTDGPVDPVHPWQALWRRQDEAVQYGQFTPRLRIGRVVFDRRKMTLPVTGLPRREQREAIAQYLLRVERWRRSHGLGHRCFIRLVDLGSAVDVAGRGWRWPTKERKPMLLDFTNPLSVLQLHRLAGRGKGHAVIEETLPRPEQLPRLRDGRRRVIELVLELEP